MISIRIPEEYRKLDKEGKDDNFILVSDEDAILMLVNIANQLAIEHIGSKEIDMSEREDEEETLPLHPSMR